jgi:hypothetical protein
MARSAAALCVGRMRPTLVPAGKLGAAHEKRIHPSFFTAKGTIPPAEAVPAATQATVAKHAGHIGSLPFIALSQGRSGSAGSDIRL